MNEFRVYLPALGLNTPQHQFREGLRKEMGIELPPTLGAGLVIKQETGIRSLSLPDLHARLRTFAKQVPLYASVARALPFAEFPVEDSENGETVLHMPLAGIPIHSLVADVLDFFENELHIERRGLEVKAPHIVLADSLLPAQRDEVFSIANAIRWPRELLLRTMVIAYNQGGPWREYERIPLYER